MKTWTTSCLVQYFTNCFLLICNLRNGGVINSPQPAARSWLIGVTLSSDRYVRSLPRAHGNTEGAPAEFRQEVSWARPQGEEALGRGMRREAAYARSCSQLLYRDSELSVEEVRSFRLCGDLYVTWRQCIWGLRPELSCSASWAKLEALSWGREDNSWGDAGLSDYLNNELQSIKTSQESHAGKRERLNSRCQPGEGLLPRKRVHTALTSDQLEET